MTNAKYHDLPRDQIEAVAGALAEMLDTMGFETMAKDCRGDRKDADLPRYATATLKLLRRYHPGHVKAVQARLAKLGLT